MESSKANTDILILQSLKFDDAAFLGFILLLSICFSLKGVVWDKPDPFRHLWFEKPQSGSLSSKSKETRDIGLKLEQSSKNGVIFWGSQSGTAEGLANRLARDCRTRFGLDMIAADVSDYDSETLQNIPETKLAIFIFSTYGEGDPSDNAIQLLSWLHSNSSAPFPINLPNLRYAAFGLGNSNYKFYNRVIDVVTEALDQFQARALLATGKADDSKGATEEDFTEWKQDLFSMFREELKIRERPDQYEPSLKVIEDPSLDLIDLHVGEPVKPRNSSKLSSIGSSIQPLPVKSALPLFSTANRGCLHLEIDTNEHPELKYKTGDHLTIWPSNPKSEVSRLISVLGLQDRKETCLLISNLDPSIQMKVPSPTNLEALFGYYLEICGPVPREIVLSMVQFAKTPSSKSFLTQIGSCKETYNNYCAKFHVTLGRLLEAAVLPTENWSHLPLSFVLEVLAPLQPRPYSISSSSIVSPHTIALTISTTSSVGAKNPELPLQVSGLTTGYLTGLAEYSQSSRPTDYNHAGPNNLLVGNKIFASIKPSKFRLPVLPKHPLILIASGSGIAPFRGFLQERARLAKLGREVGPMTLFFGCRSQSEFLYADEFATLQAELDTKLKIVTAFSRTGDHKVYVQDRIQERIQEVTAQLNDDNAYLYICGSAAMARDVGKVVGEGLKVNMNWGESGLREWSEVMKRSRRWQEDVWG